MILATQEQFQKCLSQSSDQQYFASFNDLTLRSVFQPIFNRRREVIGAEALVRITNKDGDAIRPDLFFESNDILLEDKINVERLSRVIHVRNFSLSEFRSKYLFLNVLPAAGEFFAEHNASSTLLAKRLSELQLGRNQVVMELVELDSRSDEVLQKATKTLTDSGFKIAVDDFGVKASNPERVKLVNPHILKLDRSLMVNYMNGDTSVLKNGIALAKSIDAQIVVEGIETQQQLDTMMELDIDMFQGYFLAMPQSINRSKHNAT